MFLEGITPIYNNGRIGQIVVLDNVTLSEESEFSGLKQPCLFRIISKNGEGSETVYMIESLDSARQIKTKGTDDWHLYDASSWAHLMKDRLINEKAKNFAKIKELNSKIEMLTNILIKQGSKLVVITEQQQNDLEKSGIKL